MSERPAVIVFDVNETLSDMAPMARRFEDVGVPAHTASLWFASLLRDGFALTAAGARERFAVLAEGALRAVLAGQSLDRDRDEAVEHVLAGIGELTVHDDVPEGVRRLRRAGLRVVTLSNGATTVAERLLDNAGLRGEFEALLSVEDAGVWKPARAAYEFAARRCGVDVADLLLVAVHPWDTDGAIRAGASAAWIDRTGSVYPPYFSPPQYTASSLVELADQLDRDSQA
jgi:2-haloacid dehalogenase